MKDHKINLFQELNNRAGIYQIKNILNNHIYIGSSSNLRKRLKAHLHMLRKNKHPNKHLQAAYNKYGEDKLVFNLIEECAPIKDTLLMLEQKYIDGLNPQYNMCPTAGSLLGFKNSESMKQKCRERDRSYLFTKDVLEKRGKTQRLQKMKPVEQLDLNGNVIAWYPSQMDAAEALGRMNCRKLISLCCKGKAKTGYGFKWKFAENKKEVA